MHRIRLADKPELTPECLQKGGWPRTSQGERVGGWKFEKCEWHSCDRKLIRYGLCKVERCYLNKNTRAKVKWFMVN